MRRRLALLCLALLALLGPGCSSLVAPREGDQASRPVVRLGRVVRGEITGMLSFSGELRAAGRVVVSPRANGTLAKIHPQVGSQVNQGDVVAELDRGLIEAQVQRAQAALSSAEARRAQLQQGTRPEEVAIAQAMVNAAQARLDAINAGASQSPAQALAALSAARQRLAELEETDPQAVAQAQTQLDQAAASLEEALRDPGSRQRIEQAFTAVQAARQHLAAARQPANPNDLAQAREAVANAERQVLLSSMAASPATVSEAQAFMDLAQQRLKLATSPPTEAELAAAQADVDQAAAALELARQALRETSLTAPIGGVVSQRFVDEGALVGPGVAILEIIPRDLLLEFSVPESQVAFVNPGQEITVSVDAYPQESFSGVVSATAPAVDPRDRTVLARAAVADPQGKLKVGMFAQAAVATGTRQDALLVPAQAVVTQGESAFVWLVEDGRAKRQPLKIGLRDATRVEALEGLSEGADVILSPPPLADGEYVVGS